jgi:hypothetical protein
MFTSDLLAHVFKGYGEGVFSEHRPVYFMVDEVQNMATRLLCDALDEGRGIGLHCIISHKHMSQLSDEDQSGYLYHSVLADARSKIITGGLGPDDLTLFGEYLLMDHFDPWRIKYIQKNPVFAPVESVREVVTQSTSLADAVSDTENFSEADSVSHSVQHSCSQGYSIGDSVAVSEGEQESHTRGTNSSVTDSHTWGTSQTESGARTRSTAHTTGQSVGRGSSHGRSMSDGTSDSYGTSAASGWSRGEGRHAATSTGEGQSMRPAEERIVFEDDPEVIGLSTHSGTTEGQSSFSGTSGMRGSSAGYARNHMQSASDSEMEQSSLSSSDTTGFSETDGWSTGWNEGHGIAQQTGDSEAWSRGTNRSTTHGRTLTNSEQVSDGYSDTVGHTSTRGGAITKGQTITRGTSVARTPFHEYHREDIETPVFLTPEEQKLLVQQRLSRIPERHFLLKAPGSMNCLLRAPYVADPTISDRRLSAGLDTVYNALPCYTSIAEQGRAEIETHADCSVDDVVDVEEIEDVHTPEPATALPSHAPDNAAADAERETKLWERWTNIGRGRIKIS